MTDSRIPRELAWALVAIVAAGVLVAVVVSLSSQKVWPRIDEVSAVILAFYALLTFGRIAVWAVRRGRTPLTTIERQLIVNAVTVAGVALLAYGATADYSEGDRVLVAIGAGIVASGLLAVRKA